MFHDVNRKDRSVARVSCNCVTCRKIILIREVKMKPKSKGGVKMSLQQNDSTIFEAIEKGKESSTFKHWS